VAERPVDAADQTPLPGDGPGTDVPAGRTHPVAADPVADFVADFAPEVVGRGRTRPARHRPEHRAPRDPLGTAVARALTPRRRGWGLVVPAVCLGAGVLFATSAETADGTDLRSGRRLELEQLIADRNSDVTTAQKRVRELRADIERDTRSAAGSDEEVSAAQSRVDQLVQPAGLGAVIGPALTVRLDDAPRSDDGTLPAGARPDDVVVHQQDVQAVVNALWAGGAEAMTIMGERVISITAVRCVGNTLLLHGRVHSPPFVITAIGDRETMRRSLADSPGVSLFRRAAEAFGLGYEVTEEPGEVRMPAYDGPLSLASAEVSGR
jgi:uncharacterized protein YlxW (UPF0749 family)